MSTMFRQGDILLIKQERLPDGAEPADSEESRIILAYGEVTGHAHAIDVRLATLYRAGEERFIQAAEGALLIHEEHAAIQLEPGTYRVVRQREYAAQEIRYVRD